MRPRALVVSSFGLAALTALGCGDGDAGRAVDAGGREDGGVEEVDAGPPPPCGFDDARGGYGCGGTDPDPPHAVCMDGECCVGDEAAACDDPGRRTCCDPGRGQVSQTCLEDGLFMTDGRFCNGGA